MDPSIKGEKLALPSEHPINQPYADWIRAIVSADGSRPAFRLLDFEQGFRPLHHDQGTSLDALLSGIGLAAPWALPRPDTTQLPLRLLYL